MSSHLSQVTRLAVFASMFGIQSAWAQAISDFPEIDSQGERPLLNLPRDNLKKQLQRSGILHFSSTSRFKVGIPLAEFGPHGPKLMFTYLPRMPLGEQRKVFFLYLHMDLQ